MDGYCIIVPLRSDLKNSNEENPLDGYKSVYVPVTHFVGIQVVRIYMNLLAVVNVLTYWSG